MGDGPVRPALAAYAALLWLLLILFCLRVAGQILVAFFGVTWLPPMAAWQSGLLPYPWLLASQAVIIVLFAKVCVDFTRGHGVFALPNRRLGLALLWFSSLYLLAMLARYAVRMALYPGERWTGGSIPTFFHWVLAGFLLTVGAFHARRAAGVPSSPAMRAVMLLAAAAGGVLAIAIGYGLSHRPAPGL